MKKIDKKKYFCLLIMFVLTLLFITPFEKVIADTNNFEFENYAQKYGRVIDNTNVLSDSSKEEFELEIKEMSKLYDVDISIFMIDSFKGNDPKMYASQIFIDGGYGLNKDKDGIMLVVATQERHYEIITHGECINFFTDYGINLIQDKILPALKSSDFEKSSEEFLNISNIILKQAKTGKPYDVNNPYKTAKYYIFREVIALIVAILVATLIGFLLKKQMKQPETSKEAEQYVDSGSFKLGYKNDVFSHISIVRNYNPPKDDKNNGGSNTFSGSDGSSFGGGGGNF